MPRLRPNRRDGTGPKVIVDKTSISKVILYSKKIYQSFRCGHVLRQFHHTKTGLWNKTIMPVMFIDLSQVITFMCFYKLWNISASTTL